MRSDIRLIAFLLASTLGFTYSDNAWDCSPVFDTCPANGLVMALGPIQNMNVSLKYPDPLLQLPSLWSTKADFSLSGWFRAVCANDRTSCDSVASSWLEWDSVKLSTISTGSMTVFSYSFDPSKNQINIGFKFLSCEVHTNIRGTLGYWTMLSVSFATIQANSYSVNIWMNKTLYSSYSLSCDAWQSKPTSTASVLFSSNSTEASLFNLRVFDRAITDTTINSLFLQTPDFSNPAYVPNSNSRFFLDANDPLRTTQDINSANGRLLAQGPLIARFNTTHEYSRGPVSLSYFWLSLRVNVDSAPAVTQDSYIPIYSIHTSKGNLVTIWWERAVSDGTFRSALSVVIATSQLDPICPDSPNVGLLQSIPISSPSSHPWHSVSITSVALFTATTFTFQVDSVSKSLNVKGVDTFQPAVFLSTPDNTKMTTCKKIVPNADAFNIYLSAIRFKNESLPGTSSFSLTTVATLDPTSYCSIGLNADSVQFPPPPCSGHGNFTTGSTCNCGVARAAPSCRKCVPGAVAVESNTGDPYGLCFCPVGSGLQPTQCAPCIAGFFNNRVNSNCTQCSPGTFSSRSGSLNCDVCPGGSYSGSGQTTCTNCPSGLYSTPKSASCSPCPSGTVPTADSSACQSCSPGTFSNTTQCVNCWLGSASSIFNATTCAICNPGTFANITGLTKCYSCAAGKFSSKPGSTTCDRCAPGSYSQQQGSSACSPWSADQHDSLPIASQNHDSDPGKYASTFGKTQCSSCPRGRFSDHPGSTSCAPCSPGSSAPDLASKTCTVCDPGRFSNTTGLSQCIPCPRGTSASSPNSTSCALCQPGSFANGTGLASCLACQPGSFSNDTGLAQCTLCPLGRFVSNPQSSTCWLCQPGSIAPVPGSSVCQPCDSGSVAQAGQSGCTDCPAGTFADISRCTVCPEGTFSSAKSAQCTPCPEGSISLPDRTACVQCDAGRYVPLKTNFCLDCPTGSVSAKGQSSCQFCSAGTYANVTCSRCPAGTISADRAISCSHCPNGTEPDDMQANCIKCQPGTVSSDGVECSPCSAGTFSSDTGASACQACDSGSVAPIGSLLCTRCSSGTGPFSDRSTCSLCQAGWYSNSSTAGLCYACPPGSYASKPGETACAICPVGRYSNVTARMTECLPCPLTSYTSAQGALACQPCQANSAVFDPSSATSQKSCLCKRSYFHNVTASKEGFVCDLCPEGFECGSTGVVEPLVVQAGYYVNVEEDRYVAYKCDPSEACLSSSGGTTECELLYTGFRCASCINGKSYRLQQRCLPCETNVLGIVLMAFATFGFCAAFLIFAKPSKTPLSAIGLCLSNIQLIAVFATSLTSDWTPEIQALWQIFSILNFNIELFRPECAVDMSFWTKQFLKLLLPVIAFWILLIMSSIYYMFCRLYWKTGSLPSLIDRVIFASNLILLYGYTLLVSTAADPFNCEDAGRGQLFLKREPSVSCISEEYKTHIISSYIAITLYGIGIPLSYAILLWYRHRTRTLFTESFVNRFGELTSPYNPDFFWWEIVNMIRRLLIIITIDLVKGKFAQLFLILALLFLTLLLHSFFNPYKTKEENRLATLWNLVTVLVLFSAAILDSSDTITGPNQRERKTLTIMVFVGLAGTAAYTLKCLVTELEARKKALLALVEKTSIRARARKKKSGLKSTISLEPSRSQGIRGLKNLAPSIEGSPNLSYFAPSLGSSVRESPQFASNCGQQQ